jgi:hypothetical protein
MGQTRKCLIKGSKPNKLSKTRRAKALKIAKEVRQTLDRMMPELTRLHNETKEKMKDLPKNMPPAMRKMTEAALHMSEPKAVLAWVSSGIRMNEQYANMPTLPPHVEQQILKALDASNDMIKKHLESITKKTNTKNSKAVSLPKIDLTQMPDLSSVLSGCAWEAPTSPSIQKAYKQRMGLLQSIRSFYKKALGELGSGMEETKKIGDTMEKIFYTLDIWESIPAGPTLEAEEERVVYFTYTYKNAKLMIEMTKQMMLLFKDLMKNLKKTQPKNK